MVKLKNLLHILSTQFADASSAASSSSALTWAWGDRVPPDIDVPTSQHDRQEPTARIGLDIGTSKIVAIAGRLNPDGKIEVTGMGEAPSGGLRRGTILNLATTTAGIKDALALATGNGNFTPGSLHAGLSGSIKSFCDHGILSRRNPEKEIAPHDLMQLKNEVGRAIIPPGQSIIFMQPLDFMVDGLADIRDAIGMTGARLEADFQLITAEEKAIENVKQCTRNTGTKDCQVLPVPVASGEAVLSDDEKEEGVVAVDIGASTTSIIIYKNQLIRHVEVIPIGGNSITEDIRQWASLNFQSAELLKMQFGSACEPERDEHIQVSFFNGKKSKLISRRGLTFVIQARVEELLAMIAASIQTTGLAKQLPFGVVLTGGTARLPGIRDLGEKLTGLLFHIGTPEMFLSKKTLQNDQFKVLHSPVYSAAIGLLKMGLSNN